MNARVMCDMLARATSNPKGKLESSVETGDDRKASKVVGFLVE